MFIDLATIDFCPGQGGGGEAVIRSLDVTENGTYRAPSGVDGYNPVMVNVQSGGGITPEEKAALDTLVDASSGVLYTNEYKTNYITLTDVSLGWQNWPNYQSKIGDDVYLAIGREIFKFNKETYDYERILITSSSLTAEYPLWFDKTGRLYNGVVSVINTETGAVSSVNLNCNTYNYQFCRHNIYVGEYGIYQFSVSPQKFDEENQEFVDWGGINVPEGYDLSMTSVFAQTYFDYNGHKIMVYGDVLVEMVEYEDHIDFSIVDVPYFQIDQRFYNGFCYVSCDAGLYYMGDSYRYKYVNGQWEQVTIYNDDGSTFNNWIAFPGELSGNLLVGYGMWYNDNDYKCRFLNLGDSITNTLWKEVKDVAVDLKSYQHIKGQKVFNDVITVNQDLLFNRLVAENISTVMDLSRSKVVADTIDITSGRCTLNENNIATTDMLFANRTYTAYGFHKTPEVIDDNVTGEFFNCFVTHTGRVFYYNSDSYYEFDGTDWNLLSGQKTVVQNFQNGMVVVSPAATIVNFESKTYMWDDTTSNFVQICDNPGSELFMTWFDGTDFRYGGTYKLEYDNSTWSWVEDPLNDFIDGVYYYTNSKVYCLAYDNCVYEYDAANDLYENLGFYENWVQGYGFVVDGDIIFPSNGVYLKVDFSKITQDRDNYITSATDIPFDLSDIYTMLHCEYGGKLFYFQTYNTYRYCYGIEEEIPEVPVSNGTYVLQATRNGDSITYTWVSAV